MLFLFAFSFGRHAAAATLHCCFLFALPLMMLSYGRRIGRPLAAACAGTIVYLSPLVGVDGVSAYNDVALATAAFATFYLVEIWRGQEDKQHALLLPIGLLAGFCFSIKYTGFVAAALCGSAIVSLGTDRSRTRIHASGRCCGAGNSDRHGAVDGCTMAPEELVVGRKSGIAISESGVSESVHTY